MDEVGQYIADNVKLMTNLQTIAESLATKCRGRAWIVVTAQEEMNTVVGEMDQQQSNDFSKIQARFANRMKLTSADVAEVIRKRLLAKNDAGHRRSFGRSTRATATISARSLTLPMAHRPTATSATETSLSTAIPLSPTSLRSSNRPSRVCRCTMPLKASTARWASARCWASFSMWPCKSLADRDVGQLATFDLMFEGIRTALKAQIQTLILTAERHLDDPFAVQVLKALFLVKYVKEFKATPRNLTVLMLPSFDVDLPALRKQVGGQRSICWSSRPISSATAMCTNT